MNNGILGGIFADHQTALAAIDTLVAAGIALDALSLVMSDRAAERHFAPSTVHTQSDVSVPQSEAAARLAMELRPAAALGAPGTGVVAGGPMVGVLAAAGLGCSVALDGALERLGASHSNARAIVARVREGAILVFARPSTSEQEATAREILSEGSVLCLQLQVLEPVDSGPVVSGPEAPAGDQRAAYTPKIQPGGERAPSGQAGTRSQP